MADIIEAVVTAFTDMGLPVYIGAAVVLGLVGALLARALRAGR